MKILWHSNSPLVPTGYGVQTALFAPLLAREHDLAISSYYGLEGAPIMWNDIPVFAGLGGEFGNQYIAGHASAFFGGDEKDGIVLTLMDVLALSRDVYAGLNTVCWTPVDHEPATPTQLEFFRKSAAIPITMSEYGREQLEEFDPLYCPHGVDTNEFRRLDRRKVREQVGVAQDAFVVGMVAANKGHPSRKSFCEVLSAFARFRERHDDVLLYLHTEVTGQVGAGVPLLEVAGGLNIPPDALARADQYRLLFSPYPASEMAAIYNAFDVLVSPSAGEGFGVPIAEAAACGTPAIVTAFSAMPEVAGPHSWKVGGQKVYTGQRSWQMTPNIDEIWMALEDAYTLSSDARGKLAKRAREHALQFDVRHVADTHMLPALREVEERLGDRPKSVAA